MSSLVKLVIWSCVLNIYFDAQQQSGVDKVKDFSFSQCINCPSPVVRIRAAVLLHNTGAVFLLSSVALTPGQHVKLAVMAA